jgi:hypothetical protein
MGLGRCLAIAAVLVLTAAAATFWVLALGPIREHRHWYDRVRADLYLLADKRPAEVPASQWEFMVGWTINLHSNSAAARQWVDRGEIWPFVEELERRLQGPVTVATIDWIWDEYARITKGGRLYGERYRPTQSSDLQHAQPGFWGIRVRQSGHAEPGAPAGGGDG